MFILVKSWKIDFERVTYLNLQVLTGIVLKSVLSKCSMSSHGVHGLIIADLARAINLCVVFYVFVHFSVAYDKIHKILINLSKGKMA